MTVINDDSIVTMSGLEFMQMQSDIDKSRQSYEHAAQRNRVIPKLISELKSVRFDLAKERALNSTLLQQRIARDCTSSAYNSCKTDLVNSKQILRATNRVAKQYQSECNLLKDELKQAYELIDQLSTERYA